MDFSFLDFRGVKTLLNQILLKFASLAEVLQVEQDTETYVINIDYENTLAFDTSEIVVEEGK